jgi:hypothetical protein
MTGHPTQNRWIHLIDARGKAARFADATPPMDRPLLFRQAALAIIGFLLLFSGLIGIVVIPSLVFRASTVVKVTLILTWLLGGGWILMKVLVTWRSRAIIDHLLSKHRCPACAFDLRGLTADPDGCTICPECGAAWRLPPKDHP